MKFKKIITKEEINSLPLMAFEGEIIVIDNVDQCQSAVDYLKTVSVLGFDTETKPSFKKGKVNDVSLIQLSSEDKAFLFRLSDKDVLQAILPIFEDENIMKIGAAIKDDILGLMKIIPFKANCFLELQNYVMSFGIESLSLKKLSAIVLGIRISKRQQVSNWEAKELSLAQIKYAATDAWVALRIYRELRNSLVDFR
ncbi:MAG: 3'-5' exonuclease domain-containing protein 2 [Marinifilaceae bacterium]|nr:3'-5' exonuclease domain-containing protein 2 [Marinifilaceae bacterium]